MIKSVPKIRNRNKTTNCMTLLSLYIRAQKHLDYMCNVQWEAFFFLLAFCHLPIKNEKLVPPPQLLHGLCPFVLSQKGSCPASVLCVLTQVSRFHTSFTHCWLYIQGYLLSLCVFILKWINCRSDMRWYYCVLTGCPSKLLFFLVLI